MRCGEPGSRVDERRAQRRDARRDAVAVLALCGLAAFLVAVCLDLVQWWTNTLSIVHKILHFMVSS